MMEHSNNLPWPWLTGWSGKPQLDCHLQHLLVHAGESVMTPEIIEHVAGVLESSGGGDAWWIKPVEELLPEGMRDQAGSLRKGEDTMDV